MKRMFALRLVAVLLGLAAGSAFSAERTQAQRATIQEQAVAKTLQRPDLQLHYTDYCQGEPVLLLMGGPGIECLSSSVAVVTTALFGYFILSL